MFVFIPTAGSTIGEFVFNPVPLGANCEINTSGPSGVLIKYPGFSTAYGNVVFCNVGFFNDCDNCASPCGFAFSGTLLFAGGSMSLSVV